MSKELELLLYQAANSPLPFDSVKKSPRASNAQGQHSLSFPLPDKGNRQPPSPVYARLPPTLIHHLPLIT